MWRISAKYRIGFPQGPVTPEVASSSLVDPANFSFAPSDQPVERPIGESATLIIETRR